MAESSVKLLYIVVSDCSGEKQAKKENNVKGGGQGPDSFRYTRPVLQSTLQLMGCKARHAFKISRRVFEVIRREYPVNATSPKLDASRYCYVDGCSEKCINKTALFSDKIEADKDFSLKKDENNISQPFELYKMRTTIVVSREKFLDVVCDALSDYKYVSPNQRADLILACRIRERKESVTILLCGTSGCGKSTLSALLGSRLGITTVISTDSIRHMMRSFVDEKENPLLWASTYHAGEFLDPEAVAQAKAKKKTKKMAPISPRDEGSVGSRDGKSDSKTTDLGGSPAELIGPKQMAVEGFKAQSEMVIDSLDRLITSWEERKESVIVEGVHLSLNFVMGLMKKHPSILPFMIYITNEGKHLERFAVRAKYMTLDPAKNKYVKYIRNIRTIQDYLCNRADKHLVPKINNTNVDRSVAAIHATVFSCLRRREVGEQLYDPATNTVILINEEYRHQCAANSLGSKGMFQIIQRKGSSRHLMALLNNDGSVAKAWPVDSDDNGKPNFVNNGSDRSIGTPMYGPLLIGKAEPVNLQFGNFGISAFPNDTGGTSHAGSIDGSKADGSVDTETGSRYYSSCCSSPRMSEGPSKERKEEQSVSGSDDEEADDLREADTDEDLTDEDDERDEDQMEGSVDEESTKSDEEYDDLAMRDGLDGLENGYSTDDEDEFKVVPIRENSLPKNNSQDKYEQNLNLFMKTNSDPLYNYTPLALEKNQRRPTNHKMRRRSLSIPELSGSTQPLFDWPILSALEDM